MLLGIGLGSLINLFLLELSLINIALNLFDAVGEIFISSLKLMVVPLVFFSLVSGVAQIEKSKELGLDVVLDFHRLHSSHQSAKPYDNVYTFDDFLFGWKTILERYKDFDNLKAVDILKDFKVVSVNSKILFNMMSPYLNKCKE